MNIFTSQTGNRFLIKLGGRFDFSTVNMFREAIRMAISSQGVSSIDVDFADVEYLDSSALGMLLNLREKSKIASRAVSLFNCHGAVTRVLAIANFDRLFPILETAPDIVDDAESGS